ncbi:MFS transporter [Streptomyces sp. SID3343]|uniref:MFS transporter n=1 Tax=Streptomyces sp. SID3343 TaxID=2690260 RepID=UPI00136D1B4E|nr:MFS transporter [Streptomyces sp. SID3343]MYW04653.1 DHA2 family efflux MFS transporter permease subunit [Streptomyces sp. SID3343]
MTTTGTDTGNGGSSSSATDTDSPVPGPPTAAPPDPQGHPRRWAALLVLSSTLVAVTLDNSVLNTALPSLAEGLHASTADLQWITDAYTLVFAALLLLAGSLGARFGARRALLGGLAVFGAGSAVAALSSTATEVIAWRAVMGMGAAFVMPATLAIILRMFPVEERPKAFGVWSAAAGVGVLIGPVTGGALLAHFSWASAFWINVPLVLGAIVGIVRIVPPVPRQSTGRLDLPAAVLSVAALAVLVDAIIEAPERGWTAPVTLAELAAFAVLGAVFIGWELRRDEPMVRIPLFANRGFVVAAVSLGITFFVLFGTLFVLSQYFQLVHGYSPFKAGLGAMPFAFAMATMSALSALLTGRLGVRGMLTVGLGLIAAGLAVLALTTTPDTPFAAIAGEMALIGGGMGMMMAPAGMEVTASVPLRHTAMASALNSVVRELGGVLGIAVVGTVVSSYYRSTMADLHLSGPAEIAAHDLPGAHGVASQLPPDAAHRVTSAADRAFTTAMNHGALTAAVIAALGALLVALALPRRTNTKAATEAATARETNSSAGQAT